MLGVDALHRLENVRVRIVNSPTVIERTVDKYYTSTLLEDAGLPTPRTIVTERFDEAMAAYHELGGDIVVKPIFGSEGRGIVRVSDPDTAYRVFRALELGRYVYYLQEFVPHGREDIRTRFFTFAQMSLLALLAVFVGEAVSGGPGFALVYAGFLALLMWLWYTVYRVDRREGREYTAVIAGRYLILLAVTLVIVVGSAFLTGQARLVVWALLIVKKMILSLRSDWKN